MADLVAQLIDTTICPAWKALGVIGTQVHDGRLVGVCQGHRVIHLLTFNVAHFVRMAGFGGRIFW